MEIRIGQGIDVHRFIAGRPLILGGVQIPHEFGLEGHSDADVLLHAVMDSILGAAGLGDIGIYFPNTDLKFKDISSVKLLESVLNEITKSSWKVANLDCTILAETPKVSSYIESMKEVISKELKILPSQIGIKATTTEQLGSIGRNEGIAAFAVCLLQR